MNYFMQTARLGFRYWQAADLPLAIALWTDPAVMGYMGGPMSAAAAAARLNLKMDHQRIYGFQYWPLFSLATGEHAGCAGLRPFHNQAAVLEVGVHIAPGFWSGRYGEEAARAAIRYGFDVASAEALVAGHFPDNLHSKALIGRLGFVYTHEEHWGPTNTLHPYYRMDREHLPQSFPPT